MEQADEGPVTVTAKQAIFPNARQALFLRGLADEQLAKEQAAGALLSAAEAEKEALARKRLKLGNAVIKYRAARLEAVGRCEAAAKSFTAAVGEVLAEAERERVAMSELSGPHADTLAAISITRRLGRYLSHELRKLSGPTGTTFGEIRLCHYFRGSTSWEQAEKNVTGGLLGREGNGADD